MAQPDEDYQLDLEDYIEHYINDRLWDVTLQTNGGKIHCRLHVALPEYRPEHGAGIVWVGGAGGGLNGPARGMYPRLGERLISEGISSLRLDYRRPNHLIPCILDTLIGVTYLQNRGEERIVLVGHSFGGAVVISAGASSDHVVGVAALSTQTYGTDQAANLSSRALLLLHGSADRVLPDWCSKDVFARAREPKEIHLYPGCDHGLDECRQQVEQDLTAWLLKNLIAHERR